MDEGRELAERSIEKLRERRVVREHLRVVDDDRYRRIDVRELGRKRSAQMLRGCLRLESPKRHATEFGTERSHGVDQRGCERRAMPRARVEPHGSDVGSKGKRCRRALAGAHRRLDERKRRSRDRF